MGGEELKWRQLTHHQIMIHKGLILVHTAYLKPFIKAQISGKLVNNGVSYIAITSVHSEKTHQEKMLMIIMNKSQETMVYGGCQKLTSALKLRPEK